MGLIEFVKNKAKDISDNLDIKKAFEEDKRSIDIIVLKGNRRIVTTIFDKPNNVFYLLNDKTTCTGDILVTEREQKYKIKDVKPDKLILNVKGVDILLDVIVFDVEEYINDPLSFVNNIQVSQSTGPIIINIENMSQSEISNFGNIVNQIDFTQDIENKWAKLKYDLDTRFHYNNYAKFIEGVDETLSKKKRSLKWETAEKVAKVAGVFLGEIIKAFATALLEKYGG